jgi:hypothetical protein
VVVVIIVILSSVGEGEARWRTSRGDYQRSGVVGFPPRDLPSSPLWHIQTSTAQTDCDVPQNGIMCNDTVMMGLVLSDDGSVLYGVLDSRLGREYRLYAYSVKSQKMLWNALLGGMPYDGSSTGSVLKDGSIVVSHFGGADYFFSNGSVGWRFKGPDFVGYPTISEINGIVIFTAALGDPYVGVDLKTGHVVWKAPTKYGFNSVPVLSLNESVFWVTVTQTSAESGFIAYDVKTGKILTQGHFEDISHKSIYTLELLTECRLEIQILKI